MGGKGRGGTMKIMASLGENIYHTTKVFQTKWDKPKWLKFRTVESDHMKNWSKWRDAKAAQAVKDEKIAKDALFAAASKAASAAAASAAPLPDSSSP